MTHKLTWIALLPILALLLGCPTGDDDDSADEEELSALTVRGTLHDLADFEILGEGLTVVVADPAPMLAFDEDPTILGTGAPVADGTFQITGIDASEADMGLIMIVDDVEDTYLSAATGIHKNDYEGWTDGTIVEDQIAFAAPTDYIASMETDLAAAGWEGSGLFTNGALLGFVQHPDLEPIPDATVSSAFSGDVYYADGDGMGNDVFGDDAGAPNAATTADGEGLWVAPEGIVASWNAEADGYEFEPIMVGSTEEVLVIIAFRPNE